MSRPNGYDATACADCPPPQLARNNYFTGKLLVERDFTDEQRYFLGKHERHNQRLHGSGVVCGLKVKEHPNPACRNQYVVIEPGTAIDCCGREIVVTRETVFDFRAAFREAWQKANGEQSEPDDQPHRIQICITFIECGTEHVPALFDDCGCDDTACQPNRVLDSSAFHILIDPPEAPADPVNVRLEWHHTINIAQPGRVALDADHERIAVLAPASPASIYIVSAVNHSIVASRAMPDTTGTDLAFAPDGAHIYVTVHENGETDPKVLVLDAADVAAAPINALPVTGAGTADVRLAVAPDGRVYGVNGPAKKVLIWGVDINESNPAPAPPTEVDVVHTPVDISVTRDGRFVYVAMSDVAEVRAIDTADPAAVTPLPLVDAGARPTALASVFTTAGDNLAIVDGATPRLFLVGWRPDESVPADRVVPLGDPVTALAHPPVGVAFSTGGRFAFVLEEDPADHHGVLQAVDAHRTEQHLPDAVGAAVPIGTAPREVAVSGDGTRVYAVFNGDGAADQGGVAILDVHERDCANLFAVALDGCPECTEATRCLVLATIAEYIFNSVVSETAIDNLRDRQLLPSTALITAVVKCLLERGDGAGGTGVQGPPGPPGPPGPGVSSADAESVAPADPADADFDAATGNIHFKIPRGQKGDPGAAGGTSTLDLPRLVAINWPHGGVIPPDQTQQFVLRVGFDRDVMAETVDANVFQLLVRTRSIASLAFPTFAYANVEGRVSGLRVDTSCASDDIKVLQDNVTTGAVNGAQFVPGGTDPPPRWPEGEYIVILEGDFVLGEQVIALADGRQVHPALDADHLGPGLFGPGGKPPRAGLAKRCPTGNGTEGGTFISWFSVRQP
jgi:DNA-binding beta-propeller fold protein YncE